MKDKLLLVLGCFGFSQSVAQTVTYSQDIAPLIYNHCTSCHRAGEIAPFSLTSFTEVSAWGNMIKFVTGTKYMPPWKPDPKYQHYQKENYLSDAEIAKIASWVDGGMPQGNPALEPPLPVFPTGSQIGTPDLVVSFAQSYKHVGNNVDEYRYFVLPTGLTQNKDLIALEVRPGNKSIVHHTLVWQDTTGQAAADDAATPEYGYSGGSSVSGLNGQLPSYVPGVKPQLFTNGIAYKLYKHADLKLQMHYAPKSTDEYDSTTVNLFFAQTPATRFLQSFVMVPIPGIITNGPFVLPPNQVKEFHGQITFPYDVSMVGIGPHMHKLGTAWTVYAVKPTGDTVKLIKIGQWDFNWQGGYYFQGLIHLPTGTTIHAFASYDNTTNNVNNPNNPPISVTWGENTTDEMYYLPIVYLNYQNGDDTVKFEYPTSVNNTTYYQVKDKLYPVFPNPSTSELSVGFTLGTGSMINLTLYNLLGEVVKSFVTNAYYLPGLHNQKLDVRDIASGNYTLVLEANDARQVQKIMIVR